MSHRGRRSTQGFPGGVATITAVKPVEVETTIEELPQARAGATFGADATGLTTVAQFLALSPADQMSAVLPPTPASLVGGPYDFHGNGTATKALKDALMAQYFPGTGPITDPQQYANAPASVQHLAQSTDYQARNPAQSVVLAAINYTIAAQQAAATGQSLAQVQAQQAAALAAQQASVVVLPMGVAPGSAQANAIAQAQQARIAAYQAQARTGVAPPPRPMAGASTLTTLPVTTIVGHPPTDLTPMSGAAAVAVGAGAGFVALKYAGLSALAATGVGGAVALIGLGVLHTLKPKPVAAPLAK